MATGRFIVLDSDILQAEYAAKIKAYARCKGGHIRTL
jgi:hypothetical protein